MTKYLKKAQVSEETKKEALIIARATQRPEQTKEQTKIIAQGIQKGINQYKKQQKTKARELDKQNKKVAGSAVRQKPASEVSPPVTQRKQNHHLPWALLALSWIGFGLYFFLLK